MASIPNERHEVVDLTEKCQGMLGDAPVLVLGLTLPYVVFDQYTGEPRPWRYVAASTLCMN